MAQSREDKYHNAILRNLNNLKSSLESAKQVSPELYKAKCAFFEGNRQTVLSSLGIRTTSLKAIQQLANILNSHGIKHQLFPEPPMTEREYRYHKSMDADCVPPKY